MRLAFALALAFVVEGSPAHSSFIKVLELRAGGTVAGTTLETKVGRDLLVSLGADIDADGRIREWSVAAFDRRLSWPNNFLDACVCGHGPRLYEFRAMAFRAGWWPPPTDVIMPVYGYPYDLRVRCIDCVAEGDDDSAWLVRGTISIAVRRKAASNPEQKRLAGPQ